MSSDFDPYYLWLGIPPHEQPPNHYRLLGVALYEANASVIDSAASRQSTYLHSVAAGPQRQASQKLLTEIAAARRTLLNAESKQAYDIELRSRIESAIPKSVVPIARPVAAPIAVAVPVAIPAVAAPFAAPLVAPVAAPIAAPVAVPVAAPAVPLAAPVVPVAVPTPTPAPTVAPISATAPPVEQSPLADLFGGLEQNSALEFETPTLDAPATSPSPPPPSAGSKPSQPLNRKFLLAGGGAVVLMLILGFVFRPRGDDSPSKARVQKSSTSKKKPSAAKPKPEPESDAAAVTPPPKLPRRVRFIRIELPRKGVLTLAEVEAWYDGRNIAPAYGFAEQSSTAAGAPAALAIDGKPAGNAAAKSQSSTTDSEQPWWQLDLGGAYPLEKIVIHNRTDAGMSELLKGFTLLLLDDKRRPLVELKDQPAPAPRSEFVVSTLPAASPMTRAPVKPKAKASAK